MVISRIASQMHFIFEIDEEQHQRPIEKGKKIKQNRKTEERAYMIAEQHSARNSKIELKWKKYQQQRSNLKRAR